eukprot:15330938-Ditylum_brightwellii.AAC.1
MEEMKNEISYCSQKPLVNFDNDAASCYDRIIPNLASLVGQKKGVHRNITFVHASTLEEARFKLKMALEELSNGTKFNDTSQEEEVHITLVGFVDNVTRQTNNFYNENATPEELIRLMQEDAQLWSDLLWLTVMQSARLGPVLVVNQLNNKTDTEIKYKNSYTPHVTLGHLKAPDGGNLSQKALLTMK